MLLNHTEYTSKSQQVTKAVAVRDMCSLKRRCPMRSQEQFIDTKITSVSVSTAESHLVNCIHQPNDCLGLSSKASFLFLLSSFQ